MTATMNTGALLGAALLVTTVGCANQDRQRITMLEQTNQSLTERLNASNGELHRVQTERDAVSSGLQNALDEVESLRMTVAQRPDPETLAIGWTPVPGGAMIAIEGGVLFTPGQATMRRGAGRILAKVVSAVQGEYLDKDILVLGHTDDRPIRKSGWKDNHQLSTERALAVVRYLREQSVAPDRLIAGGCGSTRPRFDNDTDAHRAKNRRVEIFALPPIPRTTVQP